MYSEIMSIVSTLALPIQIDEDAAVAYIAWGSVIVSLFVVNNPNSGICRNQWVSFDNDQSTYRGPDRISFGNMYLTQRILQRLE